MWSLYMRECMRFKMVGGCGDHNSLSYACMQRGIWVILIWLSSWEVLLVMRAICDLDLNRNATNYRDNHKHRDAMEIILHFINVKY